MKNKIFVILTIVLGVCVIGLVGFGIWYDATFYEKTQKKVDELNATYETSYNELCKKYESLATEHVALESKYEALQIDFETVQSNLTACETTLNEYNAKIEAENKEYEEWWNSLSDEERETELYLRKRQVMIKDLVANNKEYSELRTYVADKVRNLPKTNKERKEYAEKYERKTAIENEWFENHKDDETNE